MFYLKRIFALLLLACLSLPLIGTYSYLSIQRRSVRRQVKRMLISGMEESDLVLLKFTDEELKKELNWKHSKEFEYKRRMYDIVERKLENGIHHFLCWPDDEETKLNRQLNSIVAQILGKMPFQRKNNARLVYFLNNLYHFNSNAWRSLSFLHNKPLNYKYYFAYNSVNFPPPVPPPELYLS